MKLTSDVEQRKQRSQHNGLNPNNCHKTKKKFTGSYTEVNPEISRLELEFEESLPRKTASIFKEGIGQESNGAAKSNFLTLPDLAYGFVHKRSGNEITLCCVNRSTTVKAVYSAKLTHTSKAVTY